MLLAYGVFLLAGMAGPGCQLIWARMFLAGMGHEMPALVAVIAAFMCGLAVGAWMLDAPISRSKRPVQWYVGLQLVAGSWGLVSLVLIPWLNPIVVRWLGPHPSLFSEWCVAFSVPALLLLPATAALGASFPAMERVVSALAPGGRHVAALYGIHTLGAVGGVLLAASWLFPMLGLRGSAVVFCCLPLVGALMSLRLRGHAPGPAAAFATAQRYWPRQRLLIHLFFTGLLGIGYQVLVVRVLAQVLDNTIYTYAAVLAVYLVGTALGAMGYGRVFPAPAFAPVLLRLLAWLTVSCLAGVVIMGRTDAIAEYWRGLMSDGWVGRILVEVGVGSLVLLVPSMIMGAIWAHQVQAARRADGGVGPAIAANALGSALAPLVFGVLTLPIVGAKWTLTLISLGYLALMPRPKNLEWLWIAAPLGLLGLLPGHLRILELAPGTEILAWREGLLGTVVVVREEDQHRTLRVDNRYQMGGTGSTEMATRHAHLPLLMHPSPRRCLVLGVGTGLTLGATTLYPELQTDGVELVPQVIELMPLFEPENRGAMRNPQVTMHRADARRFVLASREHYDVVVGDLFHPARDGAALLYTHEHFGAIRDRLSPGGLFCQWLPIHQMDDDTLRLVIRTFLDVFPITHGWLLQFNVEVPVLGLVGHTQEPNLDPERIDPRLQIMPLQTELRRLGLGDSLRLLGHWMAGPDQLRAFAGTGPKNRDDHPRVLFAAARAPISNAEQIHQRLRQLLGMRHFGSTSYPGTVSQASFELRWRAYLDARDVYLGGLVAESERRDERAIDAFIESARISREFTPGYARCLTLASMRAVSQPDAARELLERLIAAQPAIPVARQMLERLAPSAVEP